MSPSFASVGVWFADHGSLRHVPGWRENPKHDFGNECTRHFKFKVVIHKIIIWVASINKIHPKDFIGLVDDILEYRTYFY